MYDYKDVRPNYSYFCKAGGSRSGKHDSASHETSSTPVKGRYGKNEAGEPLGYETKEFGTKKHWREKVKYQYKVTFSDGTSITVSASSAKAARAMFKDKKIEKVNEVKERK